MTDFDDRQRGFEAKFVLDEDLKFKIEVRRCRLMGLWAAGLMGMTGADAEQYARDLVAADMEEQGHMDLLRKLTADFLAKGIDPHQARIEDKLAEFYEVAKTQVMKG